MSDLTTIAELDPDVRRQIRPFRTGWNLGSFRPGLWAASWLTWTLFFLSPLLVGWLFKLAFDALERAEPLNRLLVWIGISSAASWVVFAVAIWVVVRWWAHGEALLRTNLLDAQTVSGGPRAARLRDGPAEAIARFRDDVRDLLLWTDSWLDGLAFATFSLGAFVVMFSIHPAAAFVAFCPLLVVTAITRFLLPRLHRVRAADRAASSRVTSVLGETFTGLLAFRLAGKEEAAISRLERHTSHRRRTAVRDMVLQTSIDGMASSTADITIGLTLLVLVGSVRSGDFSTGDLALFVTYSIELARFPRFIARIITSREQAIVALGRLSRLMPEQRLDDVIEHRTITIEPGVEPLRRAPDPERVPLQRLVVRNLTAIHPGTSVGIHDIDLELERGSFTVVTGPVGSGKSTLLRAIVGLVDRSSGSIRWNEDDIDDPPAWFVPPNAAHLPQIPRLFSESLRENVLLGRADDDLARVIDLTTLGPDIAEMAGATDTMLGPRGVRLSGGQAQRVATARSLLTDPELLVVDDLSSALDVATERELWERLGHSGDLTVLAVSHRRLALDRADRVVVMESGRITAQGTAPALRASGHLD